MVQTEILKLIEKEKCLFGTEIIEMLQTNGETKEWLRKSLKKLRQYKEIGFVLVTYDNKLELCEKFPHLKDKCNNGYKVRRPTFMYFPNGKEDD